MFNVLLLIVIVLWISLYFFSELPRRLTLRFALLSSYRLIQSILWFFSFTQSLAFSHQMLFVNVFMTLSYIGFLNFLVWEQIIMNRSICLQLGFFRKWVLGGRQRDLRFPALVHCEGLKIKLIRFKYNIPLRIRLFCLIQMFFPYWWDLKKKLKKR